jgi:uncharacterized protein (DUF4415 family)
MVNDFKIEDNTPEDEAEVQMAISQDPDTWAMSTDAKVLKRGRPVGTSKEQVTVRLDKDLVAAPKSPDPKGWQTRLNEAARSGLKI